MNHFSENEKISLVLCRQEDTSLHNHRFLEIVYVADGKAVRQCSSVDIMVEKGDFFVVDCGESHELIPNENTKFETINILFMPELVDKTLVNCTSFRDLINNYLIRFSCKALIGKPASIIFHDADKSVLSIIEKLQGEFSEKKHGYSELVRCYLVEIIIKAMRSINEKDTQAANSECSDYVVQYVEENYMKHITLTEISAKLNFSLPYICKRFKDDMGISYSEYLQKKRIEQSCRLIVSTEKRISEIAELVGYNDIKFFNKVFKRNLKMTPGEFKKMHNK